MTRRFTGKVALVTGALSGIGQAIARHLADEGARVVAADLSAPAGPLGSDAVVAVWLDVADPRSVAAVLAENEWVRRRPS